MEKEQLILKMEMYLKAKSNLVCFMVKVNLPGLMELFTKEHLHKIK